MSLFPKGSRSKKSQTCWPKWALSEKSSFLAAAYDPELLSSLGLQEKGVEGYLFPNTYNFIPETPPREIILKMTEQFRKSVEPLAGQRKEDNGLTPHEIVTLASIIEKETGLEAERPLVSAVFHNRLKLKMPLQSDPTVIYGLKDFNGNLTRKDLYAASPYNTYRIPALLRGRFVTPVSHLYGPHSIPLRCPFFISCRKTTAPTISRKAWSLTAMAVKIYQPRNETPPSRRKPAVRD